MKVTRVSEHIWSLKLWMFIPIHVWFVVDEGGVSLVDAGIPLMANKIVKTVKQLNVGPLKQIILTHGHADHVGAIKKIIEDFEIPVYAHALEIPYMKGELPYPRRKKAVKTVADHWVQELKIGNEGKLQSIAGLTPYFTPGHSPGHVVYYHEQDRVLLAGDLFTSKRGKLQRPMAIFTADMREAIQSSAIVAKLNPSVMEVSHGSSVMHPAAQLQTYLKQIS